MRNRPVLRSLAVLVCLALNNEHAWSIDPAEVAARVDQLRRHDQVPGVVYLVTDRDGRVRLRGECGHRDTDQSRAISADDHFYIGSVSKLFVGGVVLGMLRDETISLDDCLHDALPNFPLGSSITIGMLGNHSSGVGDLIAQDSFQSLVMADPDKRWSLSELLKLSERLPRDFSPGDDFRYSNVNTVLLAAVMADVAEQPFDRVLEDRLLIPLGLTETRSGPLPKPHAKGYRHGKPERWLGYGDQFVDVSFATPDWAGPAGNLYSTVDDLSRALPTLVRRYQATARAGVELAELPSWDGHRYGFHMEIRPDGFWGHAGNVPGYSAAAWHHPTSGTTVVVLCNLSNHADGKVPAETIADALIAEVAEP